MAASIKDGPEFIYGPMSAIMASVFGTTVGDPNSEAGPSADYQGRAMLDVRYWFQKDQAQGYIGKIPAHFEQPLLRSIHQIPVQTSSSNIAAAQGVTSGTAMTLATANASGITLNVPYIPFSQAGINQLATGASVGIAPVTLDFGFAFGTVVAGSTTMTVGTVADFFVGMPLVIAGAGNAAGTAPLLTNVASLVNNTTITILNTPQASVNPAAIGTGNVWGPNETWSTIGNMTPTAALPWWGAGPGLFLDARQAITRGIQIVGTSGGAGGTFTVKALDLYNVVCTQTITVAAGASTGYSTKAVKAILSVTPNFTDTGHNYTVGTSDVFGLAYRSGIWEDMEVCWAGLSMTSSTGYTAATGLTSTSSATTGDVRGTIQTSATGAGSGIGGTASNGTISSLALTGNRLMIQQTITAFPVIAANPSNFITMFGANQF